MKKLMFAAAIAATAAAFADPINAVGFEAGGDYNPNTDNSYFYFNGESNSSVVTNESPSSVKRTAWFADDQNANYLALDTEGGTLWRSLNTITSTTVGEDTTYDLGPAQAVAATGTYLDTLVQFTVTEDEEPSVGADDKLAIWLQAGEGTTNLMVKAAVVDDEGSRTETTFTVTGTTVEPGIWYRLTVKAVADITDGDEIPGFQIFLDGNLVTADQPTLTAGYLALIDSDSHYADISAGKYFASLKTTTTLQGVGFQGTGAVDEIVWTDDEDDVFPAGAVNFTLTIPFVENAEASISGGYPFENDTVQGIPAGTEVTVTWTAAKGYTFPNGSTTMTKKVTVNSDMTVDVSEIEDALSKETFTVTITDIENATIAATTNSAPLTDALDGNTLTNQYTVEYGATVTVTATAAAGFEFVDTPEGWTLNEGVFSIETNVTAAVELAAPATEAIDYNLTITADAAKVTYTATVNGEPAGATVNIGDVIVVTAEAKPGFNYTETPEGWNAGEGVITKTITVETANVEVTIPDPSKIAYVLTVIDNANAEYGVKINGSDAATGDSIVIGDEIVVTAWAKSGYNYTETPEGWTAGEDVITTNITVAAADVEVRIPAPEEDAPASIEIEPGAQGAMTYASEAAAAAVTNNVTITVPPAVTAAGVDETTYKAKFEPKVVSDGNGGYKVEIGLTAAAEAVLQTQANNDAGTLVSGLDAGKVTITTTPGFYYSVKYGSSLNAMNAQTAGELASGANKEITLPTKSGTSGFYQVVISIVPNEAVTP